MKLWDTGCLICSTALSLNVVIFRKIVDTDFSIYSNAFNFNVVTYMKIF